MELDITNAALEYMQHNDCNFMAAGKNVVLSIFGNKVEAETIWFSRKEKKFYLHVGCEEFEGDLDIDSLSDENQWMLQGVLTGNWERFSPVTEPKELEFYSIEDDRQGGKQVHLLGYTYGSDDNGSGAWRGLEPCGILIPLEEFVEGVATEDDYTDRLICESKQYEGDYTDEGIMEYINRYFDGKPADYRLHYSDITVDTPCGNYCFEL